MLGAANLRTDTRRVHMWRGDFSHVRRLIALQELAHRKRGRPQRERDQLDADAASVYIVPTTTALTTALTAALTAAFTAALTAAFAAAIAAAFAAIAAAIAVASMGSMCPPAE